MYKTESFHNTFSYVFCSDITDPVTIKIGTLEGERKKPAFREILDKPILEFSGRNENKKSDLFVESKIWSGGKCITSGVFTSYKAFTTRWNWNEWINLPVDFNALPRDAVLCFTILDCEGPRLVEVVGGTSIHLFGRRGVFRQGLHDLRVWPGIVGHPIATPGQGTLEENSNDKMHRLNKLVKKHESGQMPSVDWMDRLVFREIEVINDKEKRSSNFMYLMVEFPKVQKEELPLTVVHYEMGETQEFTFKRTGNIIKVPDDEIGLENLHEIKHRLLSRSLRPGVSDRDQKPNAAVRDALNTIIQYPPTRHLTSKEQDVVWKYRFYLSSNKKALTKFLKCVNWKLEGEAKQAIDHLGKWSPLDAQDSLELLGPNFTRPEVRHYAVERLSHSSDEDLLLYLLQLVQSLKYEPWDMSSIKLDASHYSMNSDIGSDNTMNSSCLPYGESLRDSRDSISSGITSSTISGITRNISQIDVNENHPKDFLLGRNNVNDGHLDLANFLIKRSCENPILASYLYWYLCVECEERESDVNLTPESKVREMYEWVWRSFQIALQQNSTSSNKTFLMVNRQKSFLMDTLVQLVEILEKESGGRLKKIERLQSLLVEPESLGLNSLSRFDTIPLPLDPEVQVCGVIAEKATLFKSALEPCRLTFITASGEEYVTIFKHGDDLRQDQLIIQMISLMDRLLQHENMDLKLTPYKVLATSTRHGFVQYIDSISVAEVLRTDGSIQNYFRKVAPHSSAPNGILPDVLENYTRSLAGYCIITYLLGIGDRHLDNLLLTKDGRLFHIDFGYILGRDPKPLPPPMKLTREMVDGMGGLTSPAYREFRRLCYTAFHQLRRHSSLILNLFSLMEDATVPDIQLEPDKTTKKVEERFALNLSDEEACAMIQQLIDDSYNAVVAVVVEQIHRLAMYMRK